MIIVGILMQIIMIYLMYKAGGDFVEVLDSTSKIVWSLFIFRVITIIVTFAAGYVMMWG